ncbi:MAG: hypothetical protein ACC618_00700 [Patescibacteria group bacterium]
MQTFQHYLDKTGEIGFVDQVIHTLCYVSGLPRVKPSEVVLFDSGELGQVMSIGRETAEILLLGKTEVPVGTKVARTGGQLNISVGTSILGKTLNSLGVPLGKKMGGSLAGSYEVRPIEAIPLGLDRRKTIDTPFETGVTMVDMIIPLGRGQRQLVVGDRKTGKTGFLLQSVTSAASRGTVVVYAAIAKKRLDIKMIEEFFRAKKVDANTVIVASSSADPAGLVFLTPYTAMTIAEYFRDRGQDVLIIFDDLTEHAKYYRELTLLARRFPGRSSYPGDIFYIHARLLERAGNFVITQKDKDGKLVRKTASITALPVAELVMGDLSGYIQTNLMAMTDGHVYFDIDLFNAGRRPPINPFLSVTRVGRQAQTPLLRQLLTTLTSFLVRLEDLKQFMHFGAELGEETKRTLALGERIQTFLEQSPDITIPVNVNVVVFAALWGGFWSEASPSDLHSKIGQIVKAYGSDEKYKAKIDNLVRNMDKFEELVKFVKGNEEVVLGS